MKGREMLNIPALTSKAMPVSIKPDTSIHQHTDDGFTQTQCQDVSAAAVYLEQLHAARGPIRQTDVEAFSKKAAVELRAPNDECNISTPDSLLHDPRLPLFGFTPENINLLLVPMLTTHELDLGTNAA
ncbi:hypothetical protein ACTXT7_003163 [Hymenolepis weldensis]